MADKFFGFGSGNLYLVPAGTNPTPQVVGSLQDVSVDFSWETKELYGAKQFPIAIGRGKGKITGKAKSGEMNSSLIASIFSGSTTTTGYTIGVADETTGTIASHTYTAANTTGFLDRGVVDDTGKRLTNAASVTATGQYAVTSGGVYTFYSDADGRAFKVSYMYTSAAAGRTVSMTNQLMGSGVTYAADLFNVAPDGSKYGLFLSAIVIPKFAIDMKNDDFVMPDLEFQAFADSSGNVFKFYVP